MSDDSPLRFHAEALHGSPGIAFFSFASRGTLIGCTLAKGEQIVKFQAMLACAVLAACLSGASGADAAQPFVSGCPPERLEEGPIGDVNHNPVAKKAMVPRGATSMQVCRY